MSLRTARLRDRENAIALPEYTLLWCHTRRMIIAAANNAAVDDRRSPIQIELGIAGKCRLGLDWREIGG